VQTCPFRPTDTSGMTALAITPHPPLQPSFAALEAGLVELVRPGARRIPSSWDLPQPLLGALD